MVPNNPKKKKKKSMTHPLCALPREVFGAALRRKT
jgi:hypothetical protein